MLDASVLTPPNENGLVVTAPEVSNGVPLLLGTASLVDFSILTAPNPNDSGDFSVFPKNDFDATEFIDDGDDDDDDRGGCCVAADLGVVVVACFSVTSFGLNGGVDVVLTTCCGRIDNCVG